MFFLADEGVRIQVPLLAGHLRPAREAPFKVQSKFNLAGPQIRVCNLTENYFLFLNQNICCGYSKELSHQDSSFERPNTCER